MANVAESFRTILEAVRNPKTRRLRVHHEHTLSQRAYFWEGDNKVIITPYPISPALIEHNNAVTGFSHVISLAPSRVKISLCDAIRNDQVLLRSLSEIIAANPGVALSAYAATNEFRALVDELRDRPDLQFKTPELPAPSSHWSVRYLDSKAGFRSEVTPLLARFRNIRIPQGFMCATRAEAAAIAHWFYRSGRSCLLKANRGESGWGMAVLHKNQVRSEEDIDSFVAACFAADSIWDTDLIIVEEFVEPCRTVAGGSPSIEVLLTEEGHRITYVCAQLVGSAGEFHGIVLGRDAVSDKLTSTLSRAGRAVAEHYGSLGYRGYFDLDCVVSHNGTVYFVETNMRRTGGTHVFDFARHSLGTRWFATSRLLSMDSFDYGDPVVHPSEILARMRPVLYPVHGRTKGYVITMIDSAYPRLGTILVSSTKDEEEALRAQFRRIWKMNRGHRRV